MSLFPPSPANGQTTIVNGVSYTYDSTQTAWIRTSSAYAGNLVVTGNLTAVSFIGDGSKLSNIAGANVVGLGNVSSVNLDGSSSNVLYGNGVFAPGGGGSADKIANGTSNVSIPAANGNVNIVAAGNTVIAVSGTGANVDGTLYSTGNIIGQYIYGNGAFLTGISGGGGGGGSASTLGDVSGDLVSVNSPSPNYYLFKMVVVPEDFTITKIAFETSAATPGCTYAPAVYSSSTSGDPSTLLASGPSVSGVVDGYNEAPLTTPLTVSKGDILFLCINQTGSAITNLWNSGGLGAYLTNGGNVTPAATVSGAAFLSGYGSVYGIWGVGTGSGGGGNAASIANGTSNVSIPSANGNVNIVAAGNSVAAFSGTGANITGALYTTGNITGQYLFGNGAYLTGISGGGGGNANNISSGSSNVDIASANANVTFSVNGTSNVVVVSNNAVGISGNVTATRFISNVAQGTAPIAVTSNTKVANLNADLLDGYDTSTSATANTIAVRDSSGNITATGFSGNGAGLSNLAGANVTGQVGYAAVANSVAAANITGNITATTAGTVTTAAQPNITSVGTLTGLNVNGNITAVNITANTGVFTGNGSGLSSIAGANVTGTVSSATTAGTVTTNAQPNITSVGTLTALSVTGNISSGNLNVTGEVVAASVLTDEVTATGPLTLSSAADSNIIIAPGANGVIDMNGTVVSNLANPLIASDAATKIYVDNALAAGIDIHPSVNVAVETNRAATYAQGGTTPTVTTITSGTTLTTSVAHGLSVNDCIVFDTTSNGLTAGTPYFVFSVPSSTRITLSTTFNGTQLSGLTNGTGLSLTSRANAGVGATLTATSNGALTSNGYTALVGDRVLIVGQTTASQNGVYVVTQEGGASTPWILTRATDGDKYNPNTAFGLDQGAYFLVTNGNKAGQAYVLSTVGVIVVGTTDLNFALFSQVTPYTAGTGLSLDNSQFSIANTTVTAGTYGNGDRVATFTVNSQGQITSASNTAIAANAANLTGTTLNSSIVTSSLTSVGTLGSLSVTGNISSGNLSATGSVSASRFISNVSQGTAPFSVSSNTKVTNLNADLLDGYAASIVSTANTVAIRDANANIAGNFFIGNGSQLTGITTSITANGTSNVSIPSSGGNVTISVDGTSNVAVVTSTGVNVAGTMTATGNVSGTNLNGTGFVSVANGLVSTANYGGAFTNGVVVDYSGSNVRISTGAGAGIRFFNGGVGNVNLMTLDPGGNANVTGNVNAAFFNGNGAGLTGISVGSLANGTSTITIPSSGGNINFSPAGIANVLVVSASGTTVSGDLTSTGNVISGSGSGGTISGANLVSANLLQGSLITSSQPNVTSLGNLTSLTVAGNSTTTGYTITAVTTGIAANGSSRTDATVIASPYNVVSTVNTGQGVVLPTPVPGTRLTITNTSANTLSVYPAANSAINALSTNAAFSLASATTVDFISATATQWYTK